MRLSLLVLLGLPACIWVTDAEVAERQDALSDVDADGFDGPQAGGPDCDDGDPSVWPGAEDVLYDGVDADCAGDSDYDADGDGYDAAEFGGDDCDDGDPDLHPGAEDVPYDGVDTDCGGGSDYDADGDGHDAMDHGGDDCDDADGSVYPGAEDAPYDGVDADCAGDSDYDADGDGLDGWKWGGLDCDDTDPAVGEGGPETLGDAEDGDCDGSPDGFRLALADTMEAEGITGPGLVWTDGRLHLGMAVERFFDAGIGTSYFDSVLDIYLDPADPAGPFIDATYLFYRSDLGETNDDAFDLAATSRLVVWGSNLLTTTESRFFVDCTEVLPPFDYGAATMYGPSGVDFADIAVAADEQGRIGAVACGGPGDEVYVVSAWFDDLTRLPPDYATTELVVPGADRCEVVLATGEVLLGSTGGGPLAVYDLESPGTGQVGTLGDWTLLDLAVRERAGGVVTLIALATGELTVDLDGASATVVPAAAWERVDVTVTDAGTVAACGVDGDGGLWLAWGDPVAGFQEVALGTGRSDWRRCSLDTDGSGSLVLAALDGEDGVWVGQAELP